MSDERISPAAAEIIAGLRGFLDKLESGEPVVPDSIWVDCGGVKVRYVPEVPDDPPNGALRRAAERYRRPAVPIEPGTTPPAPGPVATAPPSPRATRDQVIGLLRTLDARAMAAECLGLPNHTDEGEKQLVADVFAWLEVPYCPHDNPYTDTATRVKTVADLRRLIDGVPDDTKVYLFGYAGYDTVYDLEAEVKRQQCIEHSGKIHEVVGLVFQVEG